MSPRGVPDVAGLLGLGDGLDRAARTWWRSVGRRVDPVGAHAWLDAPLHDAAQVGDAWVGASARAVGGVTVEDGARGLLPDLAALDGPGFRAADVHPVVRDFYESTARWRMDVWTAWASPFRPAGELLAALFGCYTTTTLPGRAQPSVHVSFPLQHGNVQVFLRPWVARDGSLRLSSGRGTFGQDGAYVLVRHGAVHHAARVPLHEEFRVFVDDEDVLRTDHLLRWGAAPLLQLHYRMARGD